MDEMELINQILEASEEVEVPESLKPENIEKKLKAKTVPFAKKITRYSELAAAVCVLIVAGYAVDQNMRKSKTGSMKSAEVSQEMEVNLDMQSKEMDMSMDMQAEEPVMNMDMSMDMQEKEADMNMDMEAEEYDMEAEAYDMAEEEFAEVAEDFGDELLSASSELAEKSAVSMSSKAVAGNAAMDSAEKAELLVSDENWQYRVTDEKDGVIVSKVILPEKSVTELHLKDRSKKIESILLKENWLYVTIEGEELESVVDLSDPMKPVFVSNELVWE